MVIMRGQTEGLRPDVHYACNCRYNRYKSNCFLVNRNRGGRKLLMNSITSYVKSLIMAGLVCLIALAFVQAEDSKKENSVKGTKKQQVEKGDLLFDGKTLKKWEIVDFGTKQDVSVKNGQLIIGVGNDMNGAIYKGEIPKSNYEITLDAMRVEGSDFFCGLTFPVKKDFCALILGGWGGGLCGLSCLDGMDASENDSADHYEFKNKKWYHIKLRVTDDQIDAWLDKKHLIDVDYTNRLISLRLESELCKPLGFATWRTKAALKNIRLRKLTQKEISDLKKK
jgi:3-keto-disaccharide hydrolase